MTTNNPKFKTIIMWEYDTTTGRSKITQQFTQSLTGYVEKTKHEVVDLKADEVTEEYI
jgi:hypothetical protein